MTLSLKWFLLVLPLVINALTESGDVFPTQLNRPSYYSYRVKFFRNVPPSNSQHRALRIQPAVRTWLQDVWDYV
ncbi:hypothetical protein L596_012214 [Steinernema carpocapsae]|uniref:Uncharacterized protein n=1 Tax=Steinernema carpocapsae TaxID=34508 RepID=A0A4U5NX59_STECR|nr:hypothetical protein L596_012214 [Steinernema carpocapsae]